MVACLIKMARHPTAASLGSRPLWSIWWYNNEGTDKICYSLAMRDVNLTINVLMQKTATALGDTMAILTTHYGIRPNAMS